MAENRQSGLRRMELNRLENLIDGIFAIAMTILVLNLNVPVFDRAKGSAGLLAALAKDWPDLVNYAISFYILGSMWISHTLAIRELKHTKQRHVWLNILWLMLVCLVPFSASVMGDHPDLVAADLLFHLNMLLIGLAYLAQIQVALGDSGLLHHESGSAALASVRKKALVLPVMALLAMGLCLVAASWSSLIYLAIPLVMARMNHGRAD